MCGGRARGRRERIRALRCVWRGRVELLILCERVGLVVIIGSSKREKGGQAEEGGIEEKGKEGNRII